MTPKEGSAEAERGGRPSPAARARSGRATRPVDRRGSRGAGVSDDLVHELTARGDLPCLRLGRRKVVPARAIQLMVDAALDDFDPSRPPTPPPARRCR